MYSNRSKHHPVSTKFSTSLKLSVYRSNRHDHSKRYTRRSLSTNDCFSFPFFLTSCLLYDTKNNCEFPSRVPFSCLVRLTRNPNSWITRRPSSLLFFFSFFVNFFLLKLSTGGVKWQLIIHHSPKSSSLYLPLLFFSFSHSCTRRDFFKRRSLKSIFWSNCPIILITLHRASTISRDHRRLPFSLSQTYLHKTARATYDVITFFLFFVLSIIQAKGSRVPALVNVRVAMRGIEGRVSNVRRR